MAKAKTAAKPVSKPKAPEVKKTVVPPTTPAPPSPVATKTPAPPIATPVTTPVPPAPVSPSVGPDFRNNDSSQAPTAIPTPPVNYPPVSPLKAPLKPTAISERPLTKKRANNVPLVGDIVVYYTALGTIKAEVRDVLNDLTVNLIHEGGENRVVQKGNTLGYWNWVE